MQTKRGTGVSGSVLCNGQDMRSYAIIFVCSISAGFWMIFAGCRPYEPGTSMPILVDSSPFESPFSAAEAEGEVNWSGSAELEDAVNRSVATESKEPGGWSGTYGTEEAVSSSRAAEKEEEFDLSGAEGTEGAVDWNGVPEAAAGWNRPGTRANACTKSYAALELHRYLCLVSGLNPVDTTFFPLRNLERIPHGEAVVLGTVAELERFPEILEFIRKKDLRSRIKESGSFALIPDGKKLFIIGYDRTGTLYGAYHWLESLGIRWFEPGKQGEFIPEKGRVRLPRGISVQSPAFQTRGFWAWEDRGSRDFYVWMARNRLNFWTIAEKNRAFLQKIGIGLTVGGHLHFDRFLNPGSPYPFNHALHSGDENRPPDPYRVSTGEYRGDEDGSGQLSYFEAHPEWYGLAGGKRKTFSGDYGTNICTSNEDAVTELSRKLVDELADGEWKDAGSLNFWPIDGGTWCECRACSVLGTPTDRMLLLVHQVRRALRKAHEDGRLGRDIPVIFPIYNETLAPPSRPLPQDFDFNGCMGICFTSFRL